jgi:hypothetical protein
MVAAEPPEPWQHQHRLAAGITDRRIMQPQLRQGFARVEFEILRNPVALLRRRIIRG